MFFESDLPAEYPYVRTPYCVHFEVAETRGLQHETMTGRGVVAPLAHECTNYGSISW